MLAVTALAGLLTAVVVVTAVEPSDRTFAMVAGPVQMMMSITVPFVGILLVSDVRAAGSRSKIILTVLAAVVVAIVVAVFGIAVSVVAVALATWELADGRWHQFGMIAVGSLLVQSVAQLIGTGLGLLVRSIVLACLATIALPLGLWLLLGAADRLTSAQDWLTPYGAANNLLSGQMSPIAWAQWLVVFLSWGVGLNILGATRARRRS